MRSTYWQEHPDYPKERWLLAVQGGETYGYHEWVVAQLEEEDELFGEENDNANS